MAYLVWKKDPSESGDALRDRLVAAMPRAFDAAGLSDLKISVTDGAVASGEALHLGAERPDGLITAWIDCCQDRAPAEAAVAAEVGRLAGYLVVESQPLRLPNPVGIRGQRMPGFSLVGCIEPKPGLSRDAFARRWESVHRDVAIAVQSTISYVRNEVVRPLTPEAPPWGGIVEEGFPIEALTDPKAFYDAVGDDAKYRDHLRQMVESCAAFLDLQKVDSHPMSEYRFGAAGE